MPGLRSVPVRAALTLLLAWFAAQACLWLHTPIPWMIGPLLATAAASIAGLPTRSAVPLRQGAQATIGTALGLYFTPEVLAQLRPLGWAIALGVAWALVLGMLMGRWLLHVNSAMPGLDARTTFFAGGIGGASEMTLLAERHGGRTDLVAAAHSLRMLIVTVLFPFGLQWSGLHGLDAALPAVRQVDVAGLGLLAVVGLVGVFAVRRAGLANPWFLGAFFGAALLTALDLGWSGLPPPLVNAAQLVIGVSLGVRFMPGFVRSAPRWLASVALGTLGMVLLCLLFAGVLAWLTGLPLATMVLAVAPGGITEMSITAKVLQLGVPVVVAFQVCRLVALLVLMEPIHGALARR